MKVKVEVPMSEALFTALNVEANRQGKSLETMLRVALRSYVSQRETKNTLSDKGDFTPIDL